MTRSTRRKLAIAGGVFAVVVALLVVAALVAPRWIDKGALRPVVERILRDRIGHDVTFGSLDVAILPVPSVTVTDLVVAGTSPGADPWVRAKALRLRAELVPLLHGQVVVEGLAVDEPTLLVLRSPEGKVNLLELAGTAGGPSRPSSSTIRSIHVRHGHMLLADAFVNPGTVRRLELGDVDLALTDLASADVRTVVSGRLLPAGGALAFDGRVGKAAFGGDIKLDELDLGSVSPWLESFTGMSGVAGHVTAKLDAARGPGETGHAKGSLEVAGLALPIAARGTPPLDASADVDVEVDAGGTTAIRKLHVTTGKTSIALTGSVASAAGHQVLTLDLAPSHVRPEDLARAARAFGQDLPLAALGTDEVTIAGKAQVVREGDPRRVTRIAFDGLDLGGARIVVRRDASGQFGLAGSPRATASAAGPGPDIAARNVHLHGLTLRLEDPSQGGLGTLDASDVDLDLASYAAGQPGPFELSAVVAGGKLHAKGQLAASGAESSADIALDGVRLADLAPLLAPLGGPRATDGTLSWKAKVRGRLGEAVDAAGTLELDKAHVVLQSGREVTLDLPIEHDVRFEPGGRFTARSLVLGLPGGKLALTARREPGRFEVGTAGVATLSPEAIRSLLALAGSKLPFGLETDEPVGMSLHAVSAGDRLDLSGHLDVRKARVTAAVLPAPLDIARAGVDFDGERVSVESAALRLGRSTLEGSLAVEGFDAPKLTFDLVSPEADLDELFSFAGGTGQEGAVPAKNDSILRRMTGGGRLRVSKATFGGLELSSFDAAVRLDHGTLRVDPAALALYGGASSSRGTFELGDDGVHYDVDTTMQDVDVARMLGAGLGYEALAGKGDAHAHLTGRAGAVSDALRSVEGSGDIRLADGVFHGLNALEPLRKASVFGEQSLATLATRLSREGTTFQSLTGRYTLHAGTLTLDDLELRAPDADISGHGTCSLLSGTLDLDAVITFSDALSGQMRAEGSRAADVFWDEGRQRVVLPARIRGPMASPSATIDWADAAGRLAQHRLAEAIGLGGSRPAGGTGPSGSRASQQDPLRGAVDRLLGHGSDAGSASPSPTPPKAAGEGDVPAGEGLATVGRDPAARIDSLKFGGNMLAPDLKIRATLMGADLSHAVVSVVDQDGRSVGSWPDAFRADVDAFYASAPRDQPASIPVKLTVDGNRLLSASRLVVTIQPVGRDGTTGPEARSDAKRPRLF